MRRSFRSGLDRIRSNITWRRVVIAIVSVLLIAIVARVAYLLIFRGYVLPRTGFDEFTDPTGEYYPAKTLWDWLELLIIPVALGFGALWFSQTARDREQRINQEARDREQEIAQDQQREEALQNYLDKMTELLLREKLLEKKDSPDDPVIDVAQIRTVTTLRILDRDRKNILFQFLRDANLADFILVRASLANVDLSKTRMYGINLSDADLRDADLRDADLLVANLLVANLSGADLRGADLRAADLSVAGLGGADLRGADLRGTDLSRGHLGGANFSAVDLSGVDLSDADLSGANLRGANLSRAHLSEASLHSADLTEANLWEAELTGAKYDSQTKWPDGFDYENSGAIALDDE